MSKLSRRDFLRVGGGSLAGAYLMGLAGCGSGDGGGASLRMTWWGSESLHAATRKAVEMLQKKYPKISISATPTGTETYFDKLATQAAGGNAPDIMMFDKWFLPQFAERGALLDLGEYAPDAIRLGGINDRIVSQGKMDGKLYGVASGVNSYALAYDATRFDELGVEMPDHTWTWDDFAGIAAELSEKGGDGYWGTEDSSGSQQTLEVFVRQRGGELFGEDGQLGFEERDLSDWWNFWKELRDSGAAVPADVQAASTSSETSPLITGKAAMQPTNFSDQWPNDRDLVENEIRMNMLPNGPSGSRPGQYLNAVRFMCASSRTDYPEDAVKVNDALINDPGVVELFGVARGAPASAEPAKRVRESGSGEVRDIFEYHALVADNSSPPPPTMPRAAGEVVELLARTNENVAFGKVSVDEATRSFFGEAESILA